MESKQAHHHGATIKRYRENQGMTQAKLAELWPCSRGYIQKVESGERLITDHETLRKLSAILHIPLWEFGLSEYDPFNLDSSTYSGASLYPETLESIDQLLQVTWFLRRAAPLSETEKNTKRLLKLFARYQTVFPPTPSLKKKLLYGYGHALQLAGIIHVEKGNYPMAIKVYEKMRIVGEEINDPGLQALARMDIGTELLRIGQTRNAIRELEIARDITFRGSRQVATIVNAYLARAYASDHDAERFERTIDTAIAIAENLGDAYGDGTDYIFHRFDGVLSERSNGYLEINRPEETLRMKETLTKSIEIGRNTWLFAKMPYDWARAHLQRGEIEPCVAAGRQFVKLATDLKSPHINKRGKKLLKELKDSGYGSLRTVTEFENEIREYERAQK